LAELCRFHGICFEPPEARLGLLESERLVGLRKNVKLDLACAIVALGDDVGRRRVISRVGERSHLVESSSSRDRETSSTASCSLTDFP